VTAQAGGVGAVREALEAAFGLALEGLSDGQIATAMEGAGAAGAADARWLERVVDRLPIDESWLFRDDDLWTWLRDVEGPALLERAMARGSPARVLSLACSTGQEAFSLAILLQGLLERAGIPPSAASAYASVLGVDASPARVDAARSGAVSCWSVQRCRADWLRGRVALEDPQSGRHRVDPAVRAMCRFEVGNLVALAGAGNAALGGFDLVLCRNVLIYFRHAAAERLAADLARALDPGATLVVCAAEAHLLAGHETLELVGPLGVGRAVRPGPALPERPRPLGRTGRPRAPAPARPRASAAPRSGEGAADPADLVSRMLEGQQLIRVDAARGREVLRGVLSAAARLPSDAEVPRSDGITIAQLETAVRLLLSRAP
jgi:chemotaxis protein methyltransferase CheR